MNQCIGQSNYRVWLWWLGALHLMCITQCIATVAAIVEALVLCGAVWCCVVLCGAAWLTDSSRGGLLRA